MSAEMYRLSSRFLRKKGYEHYEVSSFAKSRTQRAVHNANYWGLDPSWYGFGCGATSAFDGVLLTRPRSVKKYLDWTKSGCKLEELRFVHGLKATLRRLAESNIIINNFVATASLERTRKQSFSDTSTVTNLPFMPRPPYAAMIMRIN